MTNRKAPNKMLVSATLMGRNQLTLTILEASVSGHTDVTTGIAKIVCRLKRHCVYLWPVTDTYWDDLFFAQFERASVTFWLRSNFSGKICAEFAVEKLTLWNHWRSGLSEDVWKSLCRWFDSAPGHQVSKALVSDNGGFLLLGLEVVACLDGRI